METGYVPPSASQSILAQLARERQLRTGEVGKHQKEVAETEKINARFNKVSAKLIRNLNESILNLKKFQEDCVKKNIIPEINKVKLAIPTLKTKTAAEILTSLNTMKATIDRIDAQKKECMEETQDNYEMYADVAAQEEVLQELLPEKYAEVLPTLESLRQQLSQTLDYSVAMINQIVNTAKDLIYQYFVELDSVMHMKGYTIDFSEFNLKYGKVKATYQKVFGEVLPINIETTMNTSRDEEIALQLARQMEMEYEGY